jgi:acyl dehydratase
MSSAHALDLAPSNPWVDLPTRDAPRTRLAELPVSEHAIRVWCDAVGETAAIHLDRAAARRAGFADVVAPCAMLQTWAMAHSATGRAESPTLHHTVREVARRSGYDHVVATDYEQEYHRPLVPGDLLAERSWIEEVSPEKRTSLGRGRFVTIGLAFDDVTGTTVGTMRSRTFYFSTAGARPRPPRVFRAEPSAGTPLDTWSIRLDRHLVIAAALASNDHEAVHLDHLAAREQGLPDVIASIVTTSGLVLRYLNERLGPRTWCRRLALTLAMPAVPGDVLVLDGIHDTESERVVITGDHARGRHVSATAELIEWPRGSRGV